MCRRALVDLSPAAFEVNEVTDGPVTLLPVWQDATGKIAFYLSLMQGAYYAATGVWPLVSIRSFEAVTGPKKDRWLVKTVGVLVSVIGAVLLIAGLRRHVSLEIVVLAVGSAAGLMAIDVWYVARRVIGPIYLLDAVAEIVLVALWVFAIRLTC